jgi:hypothetical protein
MNNTNNNISNTNNNCANSSKLWTLINHLQKIYHKQIILTTQQRLELCNYVNGHPFNKVIINDFINGLKS